jgi:CheY-like chemotaxis protein
MGPGNGNMKCRVLIVEDHTDTRLVMARLLRKHGYEVRATAGVAEALAACAVEWPEVVLSDLRLEDGDGVELVKELRARGPVRCVALTGLGMPADVARSKAAGFDAHLTKPVLFERLDATLRGVCGEAA